MKPYYELKDQDKNHIIELLKACRATGLGNVNFQYYKENSQTEDIYFYLNQYRGFWQLVIKFESRELGACTDIYKIADDTESIEHDYSEKD